MLPILSEGLWASSLSVPTTERGSCLPTQHILVNASNVLEPTMYYSEAGDLSDVYGHSFKTYILFSEREGQTVCFSFTNRLLSGHLGCPAKYFLPVKPEANNCLQNVIGSTTVWIVFQSKKFFCTASIFFTICLLLHGRHIHNLDRICVIYDPSLLWNKYFENELLYLGGYLAVLFSNTFVCPPLSLHTFCFVSMPTESCTFQHSVNIKMSVIQS